MKATSRFFTVFLVLFVAAVSQAPATVSEPSTRIYGKVLHRAHGHELKLTEGSLTWTLRDESGADYRYTAELEDIGGALSYQIRIPHQALASGLTVDSSVIPLAAGEATYDFVSIELDGHPASTLGSENRFLELMQNSRAATHRIDLVVSFDLPDTDGDGIPDWWEQLYGLDWQSPDSHSDLSGDGWTTLQAYLNGADPLRDNRAPMVQTTSIAAYGESENGIWLRSIDADTSPSGLEYTLTELPEGGSFYLVSSDDEGDSAERILGIEDRFSQEEVNRGGLVFRHTDPAITKTAFSVELSDGDHEPFVANIEIGVFPPEPSDAFEENSAESPGWWRDENIVFDAYWGLRENVIGGELVESALLYLLGKDYGWTLWDQRAYTLPVNLETRGGGSHFILGGRGDDTLRGGDEGDILVAGAGTTRLFGGGGTDLFIVSDPGKVIVEDFDAAEDILDVSPLLAGQTGLLDAHLRADIEGSDTVIRLDRTGGGGFSDSLVRLENVGLEQSDLHRLWSRGQLLAGAVQGFSSVTIEGWPDEALERGYSTADLIFRRHGPASAPLTVGLSLSGNAVNGMDYAQLPLTITFPAGARTVILPVEPLINGRTDGLYRLDLGLESGSNYVAGEVDSGRILITNAKQRFSIHAVDPVAVVGGDPAYVQVRRLGPTTGVIEVLLTFGGTAVRGTDYASLATLAEFGDGRASINLPIQALPGGSLGEGERSETVSVAIRPAPGGEYLLAEPASATVRLLSNQQAFDAWTAEELPELAVLGTETLKGMRSPRTGFKLLLEYALSYGVNLNDGVDPGEKSLLAPQLHQVGDGMYFEFTKRLNDDRLVYIVECSSDLTHWHSGPEYFESVPVGEEMDNAGRVRYRLIERPGKNQCFVRLRVDWEEQNNR